MAELIQKLGFDASDALTAIRATNKALGKLNSALINVNRSARNLGKAGVASSLSQLGKSASTAADNVKKVGDETKKTGKNTKDLNKNTSAFILSWQTLGRIATAQFLVRGLNKVTQAFKEAIQTTVEFGNALNELTAISPNLAPDFSNFQQQIQVAREELRNISTDTGIGVVELAEARYQEFSNQVRNAAQSNALFASSINLSITTGTELNTTLNAVSSVLNAYGQDASQAGAASAGLFEAVRLGRLRLADIAEQIGNVLPLARSLGLRFEEVAGALTTITKTGVKPQKALTQIRAIINQLQKPTEALQDLFENVFEVRNAEEALEKFGDLPTLLNAINDAVGGSSARISELFNNIRSRNAFVALTQDAQQFATDMGLVGDAIEGGGAALEALREEFDQTEARSFTKAVNDLKLAFEELAESAMPLVIGATKLVTQLVNNLGVVISGVATGAMLLWIRRAYAMAVANKVAATSTLAMQAGILGLAAVVGFGIGELGKWVGHLIDAKRAADDLAEIKPIKKELLKDVVKETAEFSRRIKTLDKDVKGFFANWSKGTREARNALQEFNDRLVVDASAAIDRTVGLYEEYVNKVEQAARDAEKNITKAREGERDIRREIEDDEFRRRTRHLTDLQKSWKQGQRVARALSEALSIPTPNNRQEFEDANEQLEYALELAKERLSLAEKTGNRAEIFRAEQDIARIQRERLNLKREEQQFEAQLAKQAEAKAAREKANLDTIKNATKAFKDQLSALRDGQALNPQERANAKKEAQRQLDIIQRTLEGSDLSLAEFVGLQDFQSKLQNSLDKATIQTQLTFEGQDAAIREFAEKQKVFIPVEFILQQAEGFDLNPNINLNDPLQGTRDLWDEVIAKLDEYKGLQDQVGKAEADRFEAVAKVDKQLQDVLANARANAGPLGDNFKGVEDVQNVINQWRSLKNQEIISPDQLAEFKALMDRWDTPGSGVDLPGAEFFGEVEFWNRLVDNIDSAREAINEFGTQRNLLPEERIAGLERFAEILRDQIELQSEYNGKVGETQTAQGTLQTSVNNTVTSIGNEAKAQKGVTDEIKNSIKAQDELNKRKAQGGSNRMFGGAMAYLAKGGSRGTDTIPAMLSPGEFVMNARSSRKFASELIAMNAGVAPQYRQEGGPVNSTTNVNIGDINVNGTSNPDATARKVVSQLRREMRRGTSSKL